MPDPVTPAAAPAAPATPATPAQATPETPPAAPAVDPATPPEPAPPADLGDAGKQAIDRMKAERNAAKAERDAAVAATAALQAKIDGKEAEHAAEQAQRERDAAALAKADERILKAEIRAAAAGKLADPADALLHLDLSALEVGADGEVDGAAVTKAITDLLAKKPYLAVQGGPRFPGGADGGTRNESTKSIDDQIAEASAAGNHALAIRLKREKAYAATT